MARNTDVEVLAGIWTQLTNSDVTKITFQNKSTSPVYVIGTVGATPPTSTVGSIKYIADNGESNTLLTDIWPGITGATRVWALSSQTTYVFVSHT